jgi:dipeptidyl aminopeptidase/acylaminoacyl peptidase
MEKILFVVAFFCILLAGCQPKEEPKTQEVKIIGKPEIKIQSDRMTPEVLWAFGRVSEVKVSPDNNTVLFGVSYYDIAENKGNRELYTISVNGSNLKQITKTAKSENAAIWRPDGKKIAYLSPESGSNQIWEMNPDGTNPVQISKIDGDISNFGYSPDIKRIYFTIDVKIDSTITQVYNDLPKADGRTYSDLMYRHWDTWEDGLFSHVFIADYTEGSIQNPLDIMTGEPFDSPLAPNGGPEEIAWSADGSKIAYTCKKLSGKEYSFSTNSEIYLYDINTKQTTNLTEGMPGYDKAPLFSPDGKKMAWLSMARAGFESDKDRIFVYDFESKQKTDYTEKFDNSAQNLAWNADGKFLYFIAGVQATFQIYKLNLETKEIAAITKGDYDYHSVSIAGNVLVGDKVSMSMPAEIFKINPENGEETQLTFINKELLDQLALGKVERRWITTTDKKSMLTWIIYPPHFDKNKKYPTLLYCQGGPQNALSQFWSYRWNMQIMAANDYIIVAPNRRGVPTFGQSWTDQISKDNGGQEMKDLLTAIDEVKKEPYIDAQHLGAVGASYGGYTVYWLAGNHNKRFKAFIAHCGVFDSDMEYMSTEEMFFDQWEKGGAPWETNNKVAQKSYAASAHRFVKNWDTPILVIHGEKDFRIPYEQGMAAFNSARMLGIPAKFLIFPTENHWVLKPQNGILWQRTFFSWLDQWLKPKEK